MVGGRRLTHPGAAQHYGTALLFVGVFVPVRILTVTAENLSHRLLFLAFRVVCSVAFRTVVSLTVDRHATELMHSA
ncbi:hypothetical protein GCM10027444_28020 [Actinopolyspora lacussalsi]